MKLHNNRESFKNLINLASIHYKINPAHVEKDYFVTLVLKELSSSVPHLIFKGGTSLSKCHKIIDRFSEDIDLTLEADFQTEGQKRKMKQEVINACNILGLNHINLDEIRSRRDYNCYKVEYPIVFPNGNILPLLLVETTYITRAFPCELKNVTSIIYDYLKEFNNEESIEKYELQPFQIRVQTLDRTLVDKVFAICDYFIDNKTDRNSRHIYDISCLLNEVKLDDNLKKLIIEVREDRKDGKKAYSAKDGVSVPLLLRQIIDSKFFKKDYESSTYGLLSKGVKYEDAIKALEVIIDSKVFELDN